MKNMKRTIVIIALILVAVMMMSACGQGKIVARIGDGDKRVVKAQELQNAYKNSESYAAYYGYSLDTEEGRQGYLDYVLNSLVETQLLAYEAEKAGYTLSAEEEQQAKENGKASYDSFYQSFLDYASNAGASDKTAYANKYLAETLASAGMTVASMKKQYLDNARDDLLISKLENDVFNIDMTDAELQAKYDEELARQQKDVEEDASNYFSITQLNQYGYGYPALFRPEGMFNVRQILVTDEAEAKDAKARLDAGEDFEAVLKEYNTDSSMDNDGKYPVGEGANYVEEFLTAALALEKEGDISDPVKTEYGYHIIKRLENIPGGPVPYDEVKESFEVFANAEHKSNLRNAKIDEWKASDVTFFKENYPDVAAK